MSLRIFHVVFIVVCIALCAFVGVWGLREFRATGSNSGLALGIVFLLAGLALLFYGKRTFAKLRELS